jgi:hypothetical protein
MKTAIALHGRTVPNNNLSSVNASPPPTLVMVEMSRGCVSCARLITYVPCSVPT